MVLPDPVQKVLFCARDVGGGYRCFLYLPPSSPHKLFITFSDRAKMRLVTISYRLYLVFAVLYQPDISLAPAHSRRASESPGATAMSIVMRGYSKPKFAEETELERRRAELAALRSRHDEALAALDEVREEIAAYEKAYERTLGRRMAELERLEAEISRLTGYGNPERFRESYYAAEEGGLRTPRGDAREGRATGSDEKEIRALYREVAKAIHPDLGTGPADQERHELMSRANGAYAAGDRQGLQEILLSWERSVLAAFGGDPGAELARVQWLIAREQRELEAVNARLAELRGSYLCRLQLRVEGGRTRGSDLFTELVAAADRNLARARARLAALEGERRGAYFRRDARDEGFAARQEAGPRRSGPCREICFPDDFTGTLYLRDRASQNYAQWRRLGPARGCLRIGADQAVRLDLEGDAAWQLARLETIKADDLQSLFIYGAGDDDLDSIYRLTGLEELYLSGPRLTDGALSGISSLANLKRIYLYQTVITDRGLAHLHHLPRLTGLTSSGNGITDEGLAAFRKFAPGVKTVSFAWKR